MRAFLIGNPKPSDQRFKCCGQMIISDVNIFGQTFSGGCGRVASFSSRSLNTMAFPSRRTDVFSFVVNINIDVIVFRHA